MLTTREIIFIVAIVLLAIAVIALSVILGIFVSRSKKGTLLNYYNTSCVSFARQNFNLSTGQIIFLGDSITDLYKLDKFYSDLPLATYNRGIGGDVTQGVIDRLETSVFALAPSKIVLMIGTNDIDLGKSNQYILDNYKTILQAFKDRLPNTEVFCMSVISQNTTFPQNTPENIGSKIAKIKEVNAGISAFCDDYGYTYIDLFSQLVDENEILISSYTMDGLHINDDGYTIWTNLLKPYLS